MQIDVFVLIESYRDDFTDVEKIIADYFLSKEKIVTTAQLAKKLAVSQASITRFCQKLGLDNYKELILLYKLSLAKSKQPVSTASKITSAYCSLAQQSESMYSAQQIDKCCHLIKHHKIIHFFGKGFNSYAGLDFQFKFSRFGKYIRILSDENSISFSAHSARSDELIIAASLRGQDPHMQKALSDAEKHQVPIILMTSNHHSPLLPFANLTLFTPGLKREEKLGNVSPQIPILIQLDTVYERYIHLYADAVKKWIESEEILHQ